MSTLSTKTVLVTGGARGIGHATAELLSGRGANVIVGDLDADLAVQVAEELSARGGEVTGFHLDVTSPESWQKLLDQLDGQPLDVLVNNAGIMPVGPFLDEAVDTQRAIVDVNLHGVINGVKAVVPGMLGQGSGQVVNVVSAVGRVASAGGATYSASKFGVVGYSEAMRQELAGEGIEVSMVMPTIVDTELTAGVPDAAGVKRVSPEEVAEVIALTIDKPRPEMWVPRWTQPLTKVVGLLPFGLQIKMGQAMGADRVLLDVDTTQRKGYVERLTLPKDAP